MSNNHKSSIDLAYQKFLRLWKSIWLFPVAITLVLLAFTALKINGSSVGALQTVFYGNTVDTALLANEPRPIRSDEWLATSQLTIAQGNNNFQRINKNIGQGQDLSLVVDAPYKEWSTIFKPHNLGFLLLPFDNAFALRWWTMAYLLVMGAYFFVVTLLHGKRLLGSLVAIILLFSPSVQWWWAYGTFGSIGYALLAATFMMKLFSAKSRISSLGWGLMLAYVGVCFSLVLYPPFQIPCALTMLGFGAGYLFFEFKNKPRKQVFERMGYLVGAALIASFVVFAFLATRQHVIGTVRHTSYPGARNILSGEYSSVVNSDFGMMRTFSAPLSFGLQDAIKGASYYSNQSEAATFTLINLVLAPFVLMSIYKKPARQRVKADYLFVATSVVLVIFVIRAFTPFFNLPFKFLLLHQVQNERLEIGLMLLCVIQLVLLGAMKERIVSKKLALLAGFLGFAFFANASLVMAKRFPVFAPSRLLIVVSTLAIGLIIYMVLNRKTYLWGLAIFAIFNIASTIKVNPLYADSQHDGVESVINYVDKNYSDSKSWAVFDQLITENIPQMAGKPALSGLYTYPQLDLWLSLDPNGSEISEYNRYAHVIFTVQKFGEHGRFTNPQQDVLLVSFDCEMAKQLPNFGHVMSTPVIDTSTFTCLKLDKILEYPTYRLHLYSYTP